jgi:hypothetical protein
VQLGYFMRDLFPERAREQVGGLTPPPTPSRVVLPLRAPTEHGLGPIIPPAPMAIEPVGTWMFRGDATPPESELEPSIRIEEPAVPPTRVPREHGRWRLALVAGIAASISAVIAAVLMMTLARSSNHVAPSLAPAPVPVPVPVAVPEPVAAPAPAPVALEPDPLPIIADPPPAPAKAKPKPKKRPVRSTRPKTKSWNPDSALPPI